MAFEEKRAWTMLGTSVAAYAVYLVLVLPRLSGTPAGDVAYAATLLWTVGGAIVANVVVDIAFRTSSPEAGRKDQRDREIGRLGEYIGQSFVVIGSVSALIMAMLELDHFWIANVIYLCFVLSAILGSIAKIAAYRWGFQTW